GIQPSTARSHRRGTEVEQHVFAGIARPLETGVEVGGPRNQLFGCGRHDRKADATGAPDTLKSSTCPNNPRRSWISRLFFVRIGKRWSSPFWRSSAKRSR